MDLADQPLTVASLYLPKGGLPAHLQKPGGREAPDGGAKYERKMGFLASFARQLDRSRKTARAAGREFLLLGDLNVAHTRLDVTNWRSNQKSEGFLPEEREWFDSIVSPRTLVDVVRAQHPDTTGPMSWWSWMGGAFDRDTGWRIDYHLATPGLAKRAVAAGTDRDAIVVNPPRRGLGPDLPAMLDARSPAADPASALRTLVYSSCNPATLATDLAGLPHWQVRSARLFDMFPNTDHAEVVVLLLVLVQAGGRTTTTTLTVTYA